MDGLWPEWASPWILFSHNADWIFYLPLNLDANDSRLALCLMWFVWFNRDLKWHGEDGMEIQPILLRIKYFLKRLHLSHSVYQVNPQSGNLLWMPPSKDFVKINCDGAWQSPGNIVSAGIICRDHD